MPVPTRDRMDTADNKNAGPSPGVLARSEEVLVAVLRILRPRGRRGSGRRTARWRCRLRGRWRRRRRAVRRRRGLRRTPQRELAIDEGRDCSAHLALEGGRLIGRDLLVSGG